jgi:hypothetical protein
VARRVADPAKSVDNISPLRRPLRQRSPRPGPRPRDTIAWTQTPAAPGAAATAGPDRAVPEEMARLCEGDRQGAIVLRFRELGYLYITLDLLGFRRGSANEVLKWIGKR